MHFIFLLPLARGLYGVRRSVVVSSSAHTSTVVHHGSVNTPSVPSVSGEQSVLVAKTTLRPRSA